MMNDTQKRDADRRLKKIEGQIRGIQKMVEDDRYCMDIMSQTRAVVLAIRGVENLIMEQHLKSCVTSSLQSDDVDDQQEKISEIMDLVTRFRKG